MTNETAREAAANQKHLVDLLRREAAHSGVWFASHLDTAANLIERDLLAGQSVGEEYVHRDGFTTRWPVGVTGEALLRAALGFYANHGQNGAWVQPVDADARSPSGRSNNGPPRPSGALLSDQGEIAGEALRRYAAAPAPKAVDSDAAVFGIARCDISRGQTITDDMVKDDGTGSYFRFAERQHLHTYCSPPRDERTSIEREVERLREAIEGLLPYVEGARLREEADATDHKIDRMPVRSAIRKAREALATAALHNQGATDVG